MEEEKENIVEEEPVVEETPTIEEEVVEEKKEEEKPQKKKNPTLLVVILIIILAAIIGGFVFLKQQQDKTSGKKESTTTASYVEGEFSMDGNDLQKLDLYFLKLENNGKNMIYSPLSIKYALEMLSEGTSGESKTQLDSVIGKYSARKYVNSSNMSFANALFIRDTFKDSIKNDYVETLKTKYNAEVTLDSFTSPATINNWVSDKTFKLIPKLMDDVNDLDFVLVNALAIDMEWVNKIRSEYEYYTIDFAHEEYSMFVSPLSTSDYHGLDFQGYNKKAKSVPVAAVANKYDIVADLGEENMRKEVGAAYDKWLAEGACGDVNLEPKTEEYLDEYMKDIKSNYKQLSSSTDFSFYVDDNVKVFAKDLREYNGVTLQYVGIMPQTTDLKTYIDQVDSDTIKGLINKIKPIALDSFEEGYITEVYGYIPMFDYEYELHLMDDLKKIGVTNIFEPGKAKLTGITDGEDEYIAETVHKAKIEFTNDGIKAAAATAVGGAGSAGCWFRYDFKVPVKKIDITFNKPFMYIIRDKSTGEVWFTGTVYQPTEFVAYGE